jgi:hypothetical protein
MSPGPSPFGSQPDRDPAGDSGLQEALRGVQALAAEHYEVLGPLGRDANQQFVFLARQRSSARLVVLKPPSGPGATSLQVVEQLDASVPPPAGSCPVCQAPFRNWEPTCPDCGADVAGSAGDAMGPSEQVLEALRSAAPGYDVLGEMRRAVGGGRVFFAREPGGHLVALRLEQPSDVQRSGEYTVSATRMMRPKMLYGAVGGDAPRQSGAPGRSLGWTPTPAGPSSPAVGPKVCPQCGDVFGADLRFCPRDGSTLRAAAPSEDLIGQVVADRYHVLSKLGEGGMGRVYLAEHIRMGRRCALKVMNPALLHDPDSVSRFNREAANASRITHPNVAAIYDFGETPEGIVYLAMEFVEGASLAAVLEREGGLTERRTIALACQIADALAAAHDLDIVHRDLKPDNIMVTRSRGDQELVKVVDFGIAKATRGGRQTVTRTGYVLGTPAYMSPEQILGETLDGRSDIYSLGCILYEMVTGERAFADPSGEVSIRQRLTEAPPRPRARNRQLSRQLDDIVATAMARSPDRRYRSAGELRAALAAVIETPARRPWWRSWGSSGEASAAEAAAPATLGAATTRPAASRPISTAPPGATAPVPLGWSEAVQQPMGQVGRGTTILRHRSTRPATRNTFLLVGGALAVVLIGFVGWWLLRPRPLREVAGGERIPVPSAPAAPTSATATPPGPASASGPAAPAADTTATPNSAPGALDSAGPGAAGRGTGLVGIRLTEPLPPGARVTLDGVEVSPTPDGVIVASPGRHAVAVRAPGYRTAARSAVVAAGQTVALRVSPIRDNTPSPSQPAPSQRVPSPATQSGNILVIGELPPGAAVSVDGRPLPQGARTTTSSAGSHWVTISAIGFRPDSSLVTVTAGSRAEWVAPALVPLPRPEPEPPPGAEVAQKSPPGAEAAPSSPTPNPPPRRADTTARAAPRPADHTGEIRTTLVEYEKAINQRSLAGLKALYPAMPQEREREWLDLFREEVKDLKAIVTVTGLDASATPAEVYFDLVLSFKPDRDKPRNYKVRNHATLRQDPAGWRFVTLVERGE